MWTLYGIKNCDTIKKARRWLDEHQVAYHFHDYRADGLDAALLQRFVDALGWEPLLNTRGTTWRKLDETQRAGVTDAASAIAVMLEHPAIIKRPLLVNGDSLLLGFDNERYAHALAGGN
ncbi:ArsC family reductase [Enterobacillus tribolii]|uniref:Spx/MgsR family transcriptional regulator n=1 Tax=Enterobacillus tribolii TaxID=1487935 RepID=A0A370QRU8_9GAMM|nr:ArsC family reductase [Enterobacillus tribolii]MBW7983512.1 ArsC family reductase [Enterobacillus tribolii]RDK91990.1 Spx/MgsR family transcriptional regulator [Enterobacillus tribolii]